MAVCDCNIAGLLGTNYRGIYSASLNGSTTIELAEDGTVLLGQTVNTLSISAYPFAPGGDMYLGVRCTASASVQLDWIQKYDCINDITYFIPAVGGRVSITGDNIQGVSVLCNPNINQRAFDANASSGPHTPVIVSDRFDAYGLVYTGDPIAISSVYTRKYYIVVGTDSFYCYLQNFSISVNPPKPANCSYSFVFSR